MPPVFVLQGLTPRNHVSAVAEILEIEDIERILISVAFVSSAGVELVAAHLEPHAANTTVFAGIRNGITSAQAMKALLDLGVELVTVDTGSAHLTFHPKLYFARGGKVARLLVGSANLTTGGLNNNVEASLMVTLDLSSKEDAKLVRSIERQFEQLPAEHPENVKVVPKKRSLDALLADPRLINEKASPIRTVSRLLGEADTLDPVPLLKMLTKTIVRRPTGKKSLTPRKAKRSGGSPRPNLPPYPATIYELMWTAIKLTERDLNIPKEEGTNRTGSMNLDKGAMDDGFAYQSYFRNEVFDHLPWEPPDEKLIERAQARFRLTIGGMDRGDFILMVKHDTKTNTKSYKQGNAMTSLSWGTAKDHVRKAELIGRTLQLSRSADDPALFLIEID